MTEGISAVLTYAIGVAISPMPIMATILILFSRRARVNGPLFLAGWALALAVVSGVAYLLSDSGDAATSTTTSTRSRRARRVRGGLPAARRAQLAHAAGTRDRARTAEVAVHRRLGLPGEGVRARRVARWPESEEPAPLAGRRHERSHSSVSRPRTVVSLLVFVLSAASRSPALSSTTSWVASTRRRASSR